MADKESIIVKAARMANQANVDADMEFVEVNGAEAVEELGFTSGNRALVPKQSSSRDIMRRALGE